jgi:hypothetical protein
MNSGHSPRAPRRCRREHTRIGEREGRAPTRCARPMDFAPSTGAGVTCKQRHCGNVGVGVSGLLYVFTRPSVKDCRKSFGRDFPRFRSFPQFGGEFYHFAVGQTANERCELVDLLCLYGRFP